MIPAPGHKTGLLCVGFYPVFMVAGLSVSPSAQPSTAAVDCGDDPSCIGPLRPGFASRVGDSLQGSSLRPHQGLNSQKGKGEMGLSPPWLAVFSSEHPSDLCHYLHRPIFMFSLWDQCGCPDNTAGFTAFLRKQCVTSLYQQSNDTPKSTAAKN